MSSNEQLTQLVQFSGLAVSNVTNTTATIALGQTPDSNYNNNIILPAPITVSSAFNGVNGLDTGSIGTNQWAYLYVIGSSSFKVPTAGLFSLSPTAPLLPFGYDIFLMLMAFRVDGSGHFLAGTQQGLGRTRKFIYNASTLMLNGTGTTSFVSVDLSTRMPSFSTYGLLQVQFFANTAGNLGFIRPNGSTSTSTQNTFIQSPVLSATAGCTGQYWTPTDTSQSIQYATTEGADSMNIWILGYEYTI